MGRSLFYNWPSPQSDCYWTSSLGGLYIFVLIAIIIVALLSWSQRWGGASFIIGPPLRLIAIKHPHGDSISSLLSYQREACSVNCALLRVLAGTLSYFCLYLILFCILLEIFRFADISQFHASSKSYFCNLNHYAQWNKSRQFKEHCQTMQHKWYNSWVSNQPTSPVLCHCKGFYANLRKRMP